MSGHWEVDWITKEERVGSLTTILCNSRSIFKQDERLSRYTPTQAASKEPQNIILVGHGLDNELRNTRTVGFDPGACVEIIAHIDTQDLSNEIKGYTEFIALRSLVHDARLRRRQVFEAGARSKCRRSHNAGNDAAYTLELLHLWVAKEHEKAVRASKPAE